MLTWAALSAGSPAPNSPRTWDFLLPWMPAHPEAPAQTLEPQTVKPAIGSRLSQGLVVNLHLVDENGHPVAGASVRCERLLSHSVGEVAYAFSDSQGWFQSPKLWPGNYRLLISHPDFLPLPPRQLRLPVADDQPLQIALQRGCIIEGQLLGTDGAPRNHGILQLEAESTKTSLVQKPDENGHFRFPAFAAGVWKLSWRRREGAPAAKDLSRELSCIPQNPYRLWVVLPAVDPRVPEDPHSPGVGIHDQVGN